MTGAIDSGLQPLPEPAGKIPDLQTARSVETPSAPMDLPRVVMRGALGVVLMALLLALVLGLWRARADMREELTGALALAHESAVLAAAATLDDVALVGALKRLEDGAPGASRHLVLQLVDDGGRVRLQPAPQAPPPWWMDALVGLNGVLFAPPADRTVVADVPRPQGRPWRAHWVASHDYEQREALAQLAETMLLLAACGLLVLAVMRWRLHQAFRPLASLLAAIGRIERQDVSAVRALPEMPVRELEVIAGALRHLGGALEEAEAQRRQLASQVQTLQEDERSRLARELHDELGQHLTALRVDAAWLQRRLADQPELAAVVAGMSEQCERVQAEVRALLTRLRPLGPQFGLQSGPQGGAQDATGAALRAPTHESAGRLRALLDSLVGAWTQSPGQHTDYALHFDVEGLPPDVALPRELVLAVYRISQEALTNVARHARADSARLSVHLQAHGKARALLHWSVEDDGGGLDTPAAWQRGNGLAGIKERVWAAGGDLDIEPARVDGAASGRPGLRLQARLPFHVAADAPVHDMPAGASAHTGAAR